MERSRPCGADPNPAPRPGHLQQRPIPDGCQDGTYSGQSDLASGILKAAAEPYNPRRKQIISRYERESRGDDWRDRQERPMCHDAALP